MRYRLYRNESTLRTFVRITTLTLLWFTSPLLAQNSNSEAGIPQGGQSRKHTVYDFSEVDISGKLKKPEGRSIVEPPEFRFRRLLDLDESFIPNIIRSVDDF
ncbi:MAG: hypothetical protein KDD48_03040 [Bdellovibrionales bacterium]|nr:hypothetical protein [Bdellovibrionales bacterium]